MENMWETRRNISRNNSAEEIVSPIIVTASFIISIWIIVAHGVIILCFIINIRKSWTNYSKQILCLSLNDAILGVACLFIACGFLKDINLSYIMCSFSFYFFFSAQCASLYHVLSICIYRALTLIKKPQHTNPINVKVSVLLIVFAWLIAFCLCSVPFFLWANIQSDMPSCQIDYLFGTYKGKAMMVFTISYLLPMLLTNIVYMITCCRLFCALKKVFPSRTMEVSATSSNSASAVVNNNRSGLSAQRKAMGTIGLILLLFNLFTMPYIWGMLRIHLHNDLKRTIRIIVSLLFAMNSAVNPFVYAMRTKFLRQALRNMWTDCHVLFR